MGEGEGGAEREVAVPKGAFNVPPLPDPRRPNEEEELIVKEETLETRIAGGLMDKEEDEDEDEDDDDEDDEFEFSSSKGENCGFGGIEEEEKVEPEGEEGDNGEETPGERGEPA